MSDQGQRPRKNPRMRRVSRRDVLVAAALGGVAMSGGGCAGWLAGSGSEGPAAAPGPGAVPVRNPAFREVFVPGRGLIAFCTTERDRVLAYSLNPAAAEVWHACASHAEFLAGARKDVPQLGAELAGQFDSGAVEDFVGRMVDRGLVYLAREDAVVYFAHEGRH